MCYDECLFICVLTIRELHITSCLYVCIWLHLYPCFSEPRVQSGFVIIINQHVAPKQRLLRLPDLLGCASQCHK